MGRIRSFRLGKISFQNIFLNDQLNNFKKGRELFKKWGYKRCEDIVWVKTNKDKSKE